MVCIIDDREDVWNFASNLVHVKPYQFFKGVGDINAPPGSSASPEEEYNSPGEPVNAEETQGGDVKTEEPNSKEGEGVKERDENDTVFKENSNFEESKIKAASDEKMGSEDSEENLEVCEDKQETVDDKCVGENNLKKAGAETVDTSEDSSKVLENGGNDNENDETTKEESIETNHNNKEQNGEGEQNNNGNKKRDKEQTPSVRDDELEASQQTCEGGKR